MLRLSRRSRGRSIDPDYQCCFCLHVRTGTILLGVIQVLVHLAMIGLVIALIFSPHLLDRFTNSHHEMMRDQQKPSDRGINNLPKEDAPPEHVHGEYHHNPYLTFAQVLLSFSFSCMLLHGAISHKPYYLLPYFCLQILDFVIVCLGVIQSVTYMADVRVWIHSNHHLPYKQHLLSCNYRVLLIFAMALTFFIIAYKAYLIGMVWSCYKYFVMKRSNRLNDQHDADVEICISAPARPDSCEQQFAPPKYEEVLKTPANAFMPPPYYVEDLSQQQTASVNEDNNNENK